jgi:hypothetical protein
MTFNVYEARTGAIANPEYNFLNVGKIIWKQSLERIQNKQYPPYIEEYIKHFNITDDDIASQFDLIADLIDGLLKRDFDRKLLENETMLAAALRIVNWEERFNWKAMGVFDMIASQGTLAYWFISVVAHLQQKDIDAQDPGSLYRAIERNVRNAHETITEANTGKKPKRKYTKRKNSNKKTVTAAAR